jgi:hypothetical protein
MSKIWNYWKTTYKLIKDDFTLTTIVLAIISFVISAAFLICGSHNPYSKLTEHLSFIAGFIFTIIGLVWLPPKRQEETENGHKAEIENLKLKHADETDNLKAEIQSLIDEKIKNSQVDVMSAMTFDPNGKVIRVKVINKTGKLITVERVGIRIKPLILPIGGTVALRSDLSLPVEPKTPVELRADGGAFKWELPYHDASDIQFNQKGDEWWGKGFVVLSDERKFDFEFKKI